jgi:hypothetical protein
MALSVLRGWMMTLNSSRWGLLGINLRGYIGSRVRWRVFGW